MSKLLFGFQAGSRNGSRSSRRGARPLAALVAALACTVSASAFAQVVTYEGTEFPEELGWQHHVGGDPERRLKDGWYIQAFQANGQDFYRYNIGGISGLVGRYFMEWRAVTEYPERMIYEWQVPCAVAAGGNAGVLYHTVMTESAVALYRDFTIPLVIVPISVGDPHTYRVEVYADVYVWYIDGVVVDSGVPEGPYPDPNASLIWGSRWNGVDATTAWDYVRFGRIPEDASGDYDSDGAVTGSDYYFFHDCLTKGGPGIFGGPEQDAGPGCRFADFDADAAVDLLDFAEFQNLFNGPHP